MVLEPWRYRIKDGVGGHTKCPLPVTHFEKKLGVDFLAVSVPCPKENRKNQNRKRESSLTHKRKQLGETIPGGKF